MPEMMVGAQVDPPRNLEGQGDGIRAGGSRLHGRPVQLEFKEPMIFEDSGAGTSSLGVRCDDDLS